MIECASCEKEIDLKDKKRLSEYVSGGCIYFHDEKCKKKWEEKNEEKQTAEAKDFFVTVDRTSNELKIELKVLP